MLHRTKKDSGLNLAMLAVTPTMLFVLKFQTIGFFTRSLTEMKPTCLPSSVMTM